MVPVRVHTVLISTQHDETVTNDEIAADLKEHVIKPVIPEQYLDEKTIFHLNPSGRFVIGGPHGDAGLTGRKIIIDTYGGWGAHGGGAFSGKDPTKVDRSGAYIARQAAKSIVASGLARRCIVQVNLLYYYIWAGPGWAGLLCILIVGWLVGWVAGVICNRCARAAVSICGHVRNREDSRQGDIEDSEGEF